MHNESKLPQWAQARLDGLRRDIDRLVEELETLRLLDMIGQDPTRHWFTIPGPSDRSDIPDRSSHVLYILDSNQAIPVCSLFKGDHLFVGRASLPTDKWREELDHPLIEEEG